MRIWSVNGITVSGTNVGGIGMQWVAETEAEAIGMTMKQMEKQAPGEPVAKLWASDITEWAKKAVASLPQ